jgi:ribulose-5-phosphate 4-epimerase/fuculose-1-phosphate aldolase
METLAHPSPASSTLTEKVHSTRVDLAALYRLVAQYGMTDLIYNHITARVPGSSEHIFINSYGLLYEEITASSLCEIDLDGTIISKPHGNFGINPAGYVIHSAIHAARNDVGCVIHTHSRAGMAVAALRDGLLPLTQMAMRFYDHVSYHDYEGPALDMGERQRLVRDLGNNDVMFLRNHGLLVTGRNIPEAFINLYYLENACSAQIDILSSGRPYVICDGPVAGRTYQSFHAGSNSAVDARLLDGRIEWAAMLRQLDRIDPSYRD